MTYKSMIAAGFAALVALFATPALAQKAETPVCANCHEQSHASIALTAHGAKNDASGSMASSESCPRLCRKLDRCDWPKPVCRASNETLSVPR